MAAKFSEKKRQLLENKATHEIHYYEAQITAAIIIIQCL